MKKRQITGWIWPLVITLITVVDCQSQTLAEIATPCPCQKRLWTVNLVSADSIQSDDSPGISQSSPSTALSRSLIGTLAPLPTLILTVPGIIVGPSLGYFYGGMPGRAWTGIGLRLAGVGGMASAFVICGWDCGPGQSGYDAAWAVFIASGGLVVGSAIYDIASVKSAVRHHNEEKLDKSSVSVTPTYFFANNAPGVLLTLRF